MTFVEIYETDIKSVYEKFKERQESIRQSQSKDTTFDMLFNKEKWVSSKMIFELY